MTRHEETTMARRRRPDRDDELPEPAELEATVDVRVTVALLSRRPVTDGELREAVSWAVHAHLTGPLELPYQEMHREPGPLGLIVEAHAHTVHRGPGSDAEDA